MQNFVFVLDANKQPLSPTHPARARKLLKQGKAAVFRTYPFTIILIKTVGEPANEPHRIKLDPGAKVTGIALVNDRTGTVVWAAELTHRGDMIRQKLADRRTVRALRRNRKTRYRQARFDNRRRPSGWLAPSLQHRVETTMTWVKRLRKYCPITDISMELVRFDTQKLQNPEISGVSYQQGVLFGYELREYLLMKWRHQCAYCGAKEVPLEIEHIHPKSKGGSDRVSNLAIACHKCNQKKAASACRAIPKKEARSFRAVASASKGPPKRCSGCQLNSMGIIRSP